MGLDNTRMHYPFSTATPGHVDDRITVLHYAQDCIACLANAPQYICTQFTVY